MLICQIWREKLGSIYLIILGEFYILSSNDLLKSGIIIMIIGYTLENIKELLYLVKAITWYICLESQKYDER